MRFHENGRVFRAVLRKELGYVLRWSAKSLDAARPGADREFELPLSAKVRNSDDVSHKDSPL